MSATSTPVPLTLTNLIDTLFHEVDLDLIKYCKIKIYGPEGELLGECFNLALLIKWSHEGAVMVDLFSEEDGGPVPVEVPFDTPDAEQEFTYSWYIG